MFGDFGSFTMVLHILYMSFAILFGLRNSNLGILLKLEACKGIQGTNLSSSARKDIPFDQRLDMNCETWAKCIEPDCEGIYP